MWAVNCLNVLASFITIALIRGAMTYAERSMKSHQYRLLLLVGGTFQLWHLKRLHQCLKHHQFVMQYLTWCHRMALEGQHTILNSIDKNIMILT